MDGTKERLNELFAQFESAFSKLEEVLALSRSAITRDSALKRFEFTFELFWKTLQAYCLYQGTDSRSPREAIQQAFRLGLIEEEGTYFEMLASRNLSVHTYEEIVADDIYDHLQEFAKSMEDAIGRVRVALER